MNTPESDLLIIGGGIVGLATAYRFSQRHPDKKITLLEKETAVSQHQTGHNSGVIHSGIYYKPGSLKAENCRLGRLAMEEFCTRFAIPFERCGKVIVATNKPDLSALERIFARGQANGVQCELISKEQLTELEPHVRGVQAIHVPDAGIVDYVAVSEQLATLVRKAGGEIHLNTKVTGIRSNSDECHVESTQGDFRAKLIVNCTGLHSDRTAKLSGAKVDARIVPFRGEYFKLKEEAKPLVKNLIYPTPDPAFPFLGVHFTRMINGEIECGPNAVLAMAREGYTKTTLNLKDLSESLSYPGFLKLASKHWRMGAGEVWRSLSKRAFVRALQKLVPEIEANLLEPAPAGVRAQAVLPDGTMVDDFLIQKSDRVINLLNAPSPAATASLNIGSSIVDMVDERLA